MTRNSPQSRKQLIRCGSGLILLAAVLTISEFLQATPQAQELFEPSPEEDLRFGATRRGGKFPAAMQTRSGVVASGASRETYEGAIYGAPEKRNGYRLDRFVQTPQRVQYDDPFRPSLTPYKRSVAYDVIGEDFNFAIGQSRENDIVIGGVAGADEDSFFADLIVELSEDRPVSLPTVGPNASLRALELNPPTPVRVYQDSAENWWIVAQSTRRVHALMQISVPRQVFGSQVLPVGFSKLTPELPPLPPNIQRAGLKMAMLIGVAASESPAHALSKLVRYFRAFEASEQSAVGGSTESIFYELTESQRGVCRHRAYSFALIALAIGIPTRFVHNEAHAWVEVWDSKVWHRIDLGGAPVALDQTRQLKNTPRYVPPSDPYSWPEQSRPASRLALKSTDLGRGSQSKEKIESELSDAEGGVPNARRGEWPGSTASALGGPSSSQPEKGRVQLSSATQKLLRGEPYSVDGQVSVAGQACAFARVDIYLSHVVRGAGGLMLNQSREVGSLASDALGKFQGQITVPFDLAVGNYSVAAAISGVCASSSE